MRAKILLTTVLFFSLIFTAAVSRAEKEKIIKDSEGKVSLPWDKFQELLTGNGKGNDCPGTKASFWNR